MKTLELTAPLEISPSLCPSVRIQTPDGPAWVCIDSPKPGERDAVIQILLPDGSEYRSDRFRPRGDIRSAMESALAFLGASGESYASRIRRQETEIDPDGNEVLFPAPIPEWAHQYSDELSMLQLELEESPDA